MPDRPNVVLIVLDTLRADRMSAYGFEHATTPAFDEFVTAGALFETVIAPCSWTRPSMGTLLTGLYPRALGLYQEREEILDDRFRTLAELFKENGYTTLGFTANPNINALYNFHQGFDRHVDSNVVFGWMKVPDGGTRRGRVSLPTAPSMFRQATEWLDEHEGPFYLQFNLMEVHEWLVRRTGSVMLRDEYKDLFQGQPFAEYLASTKQLTDDVAVFVNALAARPGWENTLFVFTSDHGEGLGDHPSVQYGQTHGRILYQSQLLVPLIVYHPTWTPSVGRIAQPVRLLDVFPTVLDFCQIAVPGGLDGRSLLPLMQGDTTSLPMPEYFVAETEFRGAEKIAAYGSDWIYIDNRAPHRGLPPRELQARGQREDGIRTNKLDAHPEVVDVMAGYLATWEAAHPKAPPVKTSRALTAEEIEELQAIGYLGGAPTGEPETP